MKQYVISPLLLSLLFLVWTHPAAADIKFATPPSAKPAGDGVDISFAISEATDVEVAIVDGQGKIVRHLAAGLLGGQSVASPLTAGLSQKIAWDRKDDLGNAAGAGPFTVRVRAGMTALLDGFVGDNQYYVARVRGMTIDRTGNLYLLQQAYDGHFCGPYDIRVFDRSGRYLRTIMPVAATAPKQDVAAFNPIDAPGLNIVPRNFYSVWPDLYPISQDQGLRMSPTMLADGQLLLNDETFRRIYMIRITDGCPVDGKFAQDLWPKSARASARGGSPIFVVGRDGKTLYAAGFAAAAPAGQHINKDWPDGRIYRFALDALAEGGRAFATIEMPEKIKPPSVGWTADGSRAAVNGLAVDDNGNLYAADAANGAVHKFDSTGKLLAAVNVPNALQVAVNDKTGAIYVLACKDRGATRTLVKFNACEAGAKPAATLDLGVDDAATPFLAGDFTGEHPQLWIATGSRIGPRPGEGTNIGPYGHTASVLRIADAGDKFEQVQDLADQAFFAIPGVDRLAADPQTDDLYINDGWYSTWRFNGLTGKYNGALVKDRPLPVYVATETAIGPDGCLYMQRGANWSGPIVRMSRDLAPLPTAGGSPNLGFVYGRYGGGAGEKGICVGYDGTVYALGFYQWANYYVAAFDKTGKPVEGKRLVGKIKNTEYQPPAKTGIVGEVPARCGGVRVDREGCVYVGMCGLPVDFKRPPGFENDTAYSQMVGSIVKFQKSGGGLVSGEPASDPAGVVRLGGFRLEGVERVYTGIAPFSGWLRTDACVCRGPRFDLDAYGRLLIPNAVTYTVQMIDNAGNQILNFGQYGNYDDGNTAAAKAAPNAPQIPLGWPISAAISDARLYVGDLLNRRVVRIKPAYLLEQNIALP